LKSQAAAERAVSTALVALRSRVAGGSRRRLFAARGYSAHRMRVCDGGHARNSRDVRNGRRTVDAGDARHLGHLRRLGKARDRCLIGRQAGGVCRRCIGRPRQLEMSRIALAERAESFFLGDPLQCRVCVGPRLSAVEDEVDRATLDVLRRARPCHHGTRHRSTLREQSILPRLTSHRLGDRRVVARLVADAFDHASELGLKRGVERSDRSNDSVDRIGLGRRRGVVALGSVQ